MYNCSTCSFNSEFDFSVATHEKLDHPINLRRELFHCYNSYIEKRLCPEWDYDTLLKVDFDNHVRRGHDWGQKEFFYEFQEDIETVEKQCDNCSFKTYSKFLWMLHVHVTGRDDNCFLTDQILTEHIFNKSKITFECDQCSFKTHHKWNLKRHEIYRHTPEDQIRRFKCEHCSYKAKRSSHLTLHIKRLHSSNDNKNHFKCDHCSFKTHTKEYLKKHKYMKHTKWFKCEQCSYTAKLLTQLTRHIKQIHSSKDDKYNFKCDHCPFKTHTKEYLNRHEFWKHTQEIYRVFKNE